MSKEEEEKEFTGNITLEFWRGVWPRSLEKYRIRIDDLEIEVKHRREEILKGSKRENLEKILKKREEELALAKEWVKLLIEKKCLKKKEE